MMKHVIAMGLVAATLSACGSTPEADLILSTSEDVQVQTLLQCKEKLSIPGVPQYEVLQLTDGRVVVSAVNGNGVSLSQARSINQCVRNDIINAPAGVAPSQPVAQPAPVAARQFDGTFAPAICPPNYSGMFRGTQYCRDGVLYP